MMHLHADTGNVKIQDVTHTFRAASEKTYVVLNPYIDMLDSMHIKAFPRAHIPQVATFYNHFFLNYCTHSITLERITKRFKSPDHPALLDIRVSTTSHITLCIGVTATSFKLIDSKQKSDCESEKPK